jgi:hypothetical protein
MKSNLEMCICIRQGHNNVNFLLLQVNIQELKEIVFEYMNNTAALFTNTNKETVH